MNEEKKNQMHQLLAVESDLRGKSVKILAEAKATFGKKADHFDGFVKHYEPFETSDSESAGMRVAPEIKEMVTTVFDKLGYVKDSIVPAIDAQVSKEETNSSGTVKAELIVGGARMGEWSAQSLLAIEAFLIKIRDVFNSVPTLDPVKRWEIDPARSSVYQTPEYSTYRTEKKYKVITLAPATKEHPAQTQLANIDQQVGTMKTTYSSGRITPKQKSEYLGRIDEFIIAVKSTRSRANQADVINKKIGKQIFGFIFKD